MGSCRSQRETRALTSSAVMFCLCSFLLHSGPKGGFFFFFKTVITSSKQRRHPGHHCSRQPRQATLVLSLKESFYLWDISLTLCNDTWSTTSVTSLITGSFFYLCSQFITSRVRSYCQKKTFSCCCDYHTNTVYSIILFPFETLWFCFLWSYNGSDQRTTRILSIYFFKLINSSELIVADNDGSKGPVWW